MLVGAAVILHKQEEKMCAVQKEKEEAISKLQTEFSSLKAGYDGKVSGLEADLKAAQDRVASAETKSGLLEKENAELKATLEFRRPEEDVLSEFKASDEYDKAMANVVSTKIRRC